MISYGTCYTETYLYGTTALFLIVNALMGMHTPKVFVNSTTL